MGCVPAETLPRTAVIPPSPSPSSSSGCIPVESLPSTGRGIDTWEKGIRFGFCPERGGEGRRESVPGPAERDRRRAPRQVAAPGSRGQIRATVDVDVLDVSPTGLRLELATPLRPGSVYDIKVDLGGFVLASRVRITRCAAGSYRDDGRGGRLLLFRAGAEILWSDPSSADELGHFLKQKGARRQDSSVGILRPVE